MFHCTIAAIGESACAMRGAFPNDVGPIEHPARRPARTPCAAGSVCAVVRTQPRGRTSRASSSVYLAADRRPPRCAVDQLGDRPEAIDTCARPGPWGRRLRHLRPHFIGEHSGVRHATGALAAAGGRFSPSDEQSRIHPSEVSRDGVRTAWSSSFLIAKA